MEVNFSMEGTGACPMCKKWRLCRIHNYLTTTINDVVEKKYDHVMEIVIYRCPEFEENQQ